MSSCVGVTNRITPAANQTTLILSTVHYSVQLLLYVVAMCYIVSYKFLLYVVCCIYLALLLHLVLVLYVVTLCTLAWKNSFAECQGLNK